MNDPSATRAADTPPPACSGCLDLRQLADALPPDVKRKLSLHDLKRICDAYGTCAREQHRVILMHAIGAIAGEPATLDDCVSIAHNALTECGYLGDEPHPFNRPNAGGQRPPAAGGTSEPHCSRQNGGQYED